MKDRTTVTDKISVTLIKGKPMFTVIRSVEQIPYSWLENSPFPLVRYDSHVTLTVMADDPLNAEDIVNNALAEQ